MVVGMGHGQIWVQAVTLVILYIITFAAILVFLVLLWTPLFLPISVIFGPAGPLGYVLTLYANAQFFTTMIVNSHLATPLLDYTIASLMGIHIEYKRHNPELVEPEAFSAYDVLTVLRLVMSVAVMVVLVTIPILGPVLLMFVMNVKFSYDFYERFLILRGLNQVQRRDVFYQHILQFAYFGGSYTVLNFVPLFSVWGFVCYPLAIKMWATSNIIHFTAEEVESITE
ncbi:ACR283Wp [Eremothecium gossypii ATCC 10895]|uniref:ACR283Wp n=1 Tax=Eremothecium gossypii (strain ATCC 10895 / CBS 109.51 / FGSC 9923 / NRRL Y-1056) TaxID=284811 RepID=Q75BI8_EREGS|nr:ACR283Wp [Eremothecium gossypii ATCC 10895]AAS51509.1 ACR283Wp [Eremothecium gossypii ATCC 10895]